MSGFGCGPATRICESLIAEEGKRLKDRSSGSVTVMEEEREGKRERERGSESDSEKRHGD